MLVDWAGLDWKVAVYGKRYTVLKENQQTDNFFLTFFFGLSHYDLDN